ncbi:hypothetical protein AX14_009635 [Amanita brunnescens Koide BX004]|nr:hypothetical protein AX14_009635 [Amanita brunnescens Koide BX004]
MYNIATFPQIRLVLWTVKLSLIMGTIFEVTLTAAMCHLLYPDATMLEKTKSMVDTIICHVIISGALTSIFSIVILITLFVMPDNAIFLGFTFVWTKRRPSRLSRVLYANSIVL